VILRPEGPATPAPNSPAMRTCWMCNSVQGDRARFCDQCGAPLGPARAAAAPPPPVEVRHLRTPGGLRLAYALTGRGPRTLFVVPGLVTHLAFDWQVPEIRAFYERLATGLRLLRYDRIGGGLSDRSEVPYDAIREADDAFALLRHLGTGTVDVFGWSQGVQAAVALAARHPEAVGRLVLCIGTPAGPAALDPPDAMALARGRLLRELVDVDFDLACQAIIEALLPGLDPGWARWCAAYMRMTMPPAAVRLRREVADAADVRPLLPAVRAPTLVLRRRDEPALPGHRDPLAGGAWCTDTPSAYIARHVPDARLVDLPEGWHLPFLGDTEPMHAAVTSFLGAQAPRPELTPRERAVLHAMAEGLSNRAIAARLGCSPSTVKRHAEHIFTKLGVGSRAAAVAALARLRLG
jgi:pimeloyl-ACP methyl ester carboxylesterase